MLLSGRGMDLIVCRNPSLLSVPHFQLKVPSIQISVTCDMSFALSSYRLFADIELELFHSRAAQGQVQADSLKVTRPQARQANDCSS